MSKGNKGIKGNSTTNLLDVSKSSLPNPIGKDKKRNTSFYLPLEGKIHYLNP